MRLGKGVVDFWMETVELNQTWSLRRSLDGLRSENGGAGTEPRSLLRGEPRLRICALSRAMYFLRAFGSIGVFDLISL